MPRARVARGGRRGRRRRRATRSRPRTRSARRSSSEASRCTRVTASRADEFTARPARRRRRPGRAGDRRRRRADAAHGRAPARSSTRSSRGVSEETTTGRRAPARARAEGKLAFPAIAANDARCKHMFDNPYGTGQTTLTAILALTNVLAAGREFCVVGYGWVGKGVARAAAGLGGRVTVVELDPVRALTAHMDGFRVAPLAEALPARRRRGHRHRPDRSRREPRRSTCSRTASCSRTPVTTIARSTSPRSPRRRTRSSMRARGEDLRARRPPRARARRRRARQHRRSRRQPDRDHGPLVLRAGALDPPPRLRRSLPPGVNRFPDELDDLIARTKLRTLGIELDRADRGAASRSARRWRPL